MQFLKNLLDQNNYKFYQTILINQVSVKICILYSVELLAY